MRPHIHWMRGMPFLYSEDKVTDGVNDESVDLHVLPKWGEDDP